MHDLKNKRCQLVFLTHLEHQPSCLCPQTIEDELETTLKTHLKKYWDNLKLVFKRCKPINGRSRVKVSFETALKDVDAIHAALKKHNWLKRYQAVKLRDEASLEISKACYPLIAEIELELRRFVDFVLLESLGWNWHEMLATNHDAVRSTTRTQKDSREGHLHEHWLDFSQLKHLLWFITGQWSAVDPNEPIATGDLIALMDQCNDYDTLRSELKDKVRIRSLWDEVFADLFEDQQQWTRLREQLNGIIVETRHKTMHQRPIRLYEYEKVLKFHEEFMPLIVNLRPNIEIQPEHNDILEQTQQRIASHTAKTFEQRYPLATTIDLDKLRAGLGIHTSIMEDLHTHHEAKRTNLAIANKWAKINSAQQNLSQTAFDVVSRVANNQHNMQQLMNNHQSIINDIAKTKTAFVGLQTSMGSMEKFYQTHTINPNSIMAQAAKKAKSIRKPTGLTTLSSLQKPK